MQLRGINHYNLRASPEMIEMLKNFYIQIVGLTIGPRPKFKNGGYWLYINNKDVLHLSWSKNEIENLCNVVSTFDHIAFTGSDEVSYEKHLIKNGIKFNKREIPEIKTLQFFFKDPAGNGIEIIFPKEVK